MSKEQQNYINHIALVLDASGSMGGLKEQLIQVADSQIAYLARRSQELDQETRVSVYTFDSTVRCVIYDKDVLRLPSISKLYRIGGMTALIDATLKALDDLSHTPELYGEHAFLTYVLTDGEENRSVNKPDTLQRRLEKLPDHWTTAVFVPNANGVHEAKKFGFPKDNISVWDPSDRGIKEVGEVIKRATETFMQARSLGIRGSRNLFSMNLQDLSKSIVTQAVRKLGPGQFRKFPVSDYVQISDFVESKLKRPYKIGEAFYQLTVPVKVQAQKEVAIYDRKEHTVYVGKEARQLLGLPDYEVKVSPALHQNYDIFVQSTSVNRKLLPGTSVLVISQ